MANPEHVPELDGFDRATVSLYRAGLVASALSLAALTVSCGMGWDTQPARAAVLAGTALAVANVHLYDKRIRWVIGASAWTGAAGVTAGAVAGGVPGHWLAHAGLGFLFVSLSALALKERFCFRLPGLRLVPLLLATSLIPLVAELPGPAALILAPVAVLYVLLAGAKLRMPLHFDVGDKSRYQI